MSEVELVFGLWSIFFLIAYFFIQGNSAVSTYLFSLNFTEPLFVFVIICLSATRPILNFSKRLITSISKILPLEASISFYISTLVIGPILGSFITEPAAMTVTALILFENLFQESISAKFKYATMALLFVNVSIGGTLTPYAAPPVLMIASKWQWDLSYMIGHFGYKSLLSIIISTLIYSFIFKNELIKIGKTKFENKKNILKFSNSPSWIIAVHLLFLLLVVLSAHSPIRFFILFGLFLLFVYFTRKDQDSLKFKESFLVCFFLAGLVCLGGMQGWWLKPILSMLGDSALLIGSTVLTSLTDNAALTYLGSWANLSESGKYALVAGAVAGGGLSIIANAPNPAGVAILEESFGEEGISAFSLFKWALLPTSITLICFLFLPNLL